MRRWAFALHSASSFVVGLAATLGAANADGQHGDDGWRRTAHGWEHADIVAAHDAVHFDSRFVFRSESEVPAIRWDFHPGVLAAGQVALVMAAFCLWQQAARKPVLKAGRNGKEDASVHKSRPARTA